MAESGGEAEVDELLPVGANHLPVWSAAGSTW